jgi:hypothetical protein
MARSSPIVPERKMNGVSGASSRGQAVEAGQREIGEDEIGLEIDERAPEDGFGIHALPVARETTSLELTDGDLRLHRHVFHQDQSDWLHSLFPATS